MRAHVYRGQYRLPWKDHAFTQNGFNTLGNDNWAALLPRPLQTLAPLEAIYVYGGYKAIVGAYTGDNSYKNASALLNTGPQPGFIIECGNGADRIALMYGRIATQHFLGAAYKYKYIFVFVGLAANDNTTVPAAQQAPHSGVLIQYDRGFSAEYFRYWIDRITGNE